MKKVLLVLLMVAGACTVVDETPQPPELDDGYIKATVNGKEFESYANTFISESQGFEMLNLYGYDKNIINPFQNYMGYSMFYDTLRAKYSVIYIQENNGYASGALFGEKDYDAVIAYYDPIVYDGDSGYVEIFHDRNEEGEWILRGTFSATFLVQGEFIGYDKRSYPDTVKVRNGTFKGLVVDKRGEED